MKGRKRKRKKQNLLLGEKIIGAGIMLTLIFGSALDGPNWIFPLVMVGVGLVVTEIGSVIAKMEGSEYV